MDARAQRFGGIERLYGKHSLSRLASTRVAVIGLGGVGSWVVEALVRSGVGRLLLVDLDDICVTNTNRQIHALDGEYGRPKTDSLLERCKKINPDCDILPVEEFLTEMNADRLLASGLDYVVDAIDDVPHKALLLARCKSINIPVVTTGGAGGKRDPTQILVSDLAITSHDGLAKSVRKLLRKNYEFPAPPALFGIECVHSREAAVYPDSTGGTCIQPEAGSSLKMDCASGLGAAVYVTATFGLIAASRVVHHLTCSNIQAQQR